MKLETTIPPRRDGTIIRKFDDRKYVFTQDADGRLVADVDNRDDLALLLQSGDFLPIDDEGFDEAQKLMQESVPDDDEGVDDGTVVGDTEDLDDDEGDMEAPLIEEPASSVANPAPAKVGRPRKAK